MLRRDEEEPDSSEDDESRHENVAVSPEIAARVRSFVGHDLRRGELGRFLAQAADEFMRNHTKQAIEAKNAGLPYHSIWGRADTNPPARRSNGSSFRQDLV